MYETTVGLDEARGRLLGQIRSLADAPPYSRVMIGLPDGITPFEEAWQDVTGGVRRVQEEVSVEYFGTPSNFTFGGTRVIEGPSVAEVQEMMLQRRYGGVRPDAIVEAK